MKTIEESYRAVRSEISFNHNMFFRHESQIFAVGRVDIEHDGIGRSWFSVELVSLGESRSASRIVICGTAPINASEFLKLL